MATGRRYRPVDATETITGYPTRCTTSPLLGRSTAAVVAVADSRPTSPPHSALLTDLQPHASFFYNTEGRRTSKHRHGNNPHQSAANRLIGSAGTGCGRGCWGCLRAGLPGLGGCWWRAGGGGRLGNAVGWQAVGAAGVEGIAARVGDSPPATGSAAPGGGAWKLVGRPPLVGGAGAGPRYGFRPTVV